MSLRIDALLVQLPASLGARRFHIAQLLRSELAQMQWPQGEWPALMVPPISIAARYSDMRVARAIAEQIHAAALRRERMGAQA